MSLTLGSESGPICYVNEPTTCTDVVNQDSVGPTGFSWQACENRPKGKWCSREILHYLLISCIQIITTKIVSMALSTDNPWNVFRMLSRNKC